MIEGGCPGTASAVDLSEAVIGGSAPGRVPRALIESLVGLVWTLQIRECQAEGVVRLAIRRIGVAHGEPGDGGAEIFLGIKEFTAIQVPAAEGKIAAAVAGVPLDGLAPIDLRSAGGVTILLKMEAGQKEFIVAGHFFGHGRLSCDGGRRHRLNFVWRIAKEAAIAVCECDLERTGSSAAGELQMQRIGGGEIAGPAPGLGVTDEEGKTRIGKIFGDL